MQFTGLRRKRIFDVLFSASVLILLSPLFLLIALLVTLTSRGAPIYSHLRVGKKGKPFRCYKFRTMIRDSDLILEKILLEDRKLRKEWEATHKLKNDPRITSLGHLLRKTSLDELPQFWNVLVGDLSVVGPRPVIQEEISRHFGEKAEKILSIRPGLTGIWQTSGRSNTCYTSRLIFDEQYVDCRSLSLDLKLIAKTIPLMIFSKDAY